MRTMRTVILTIAILGVSPAAEAETRKLPVTADVGICAHRKEVHLNTGGNSRIRIKGNEHYYLFDFDARAIRSWRITKATLHLKLARGRLRKVAICTVPLPWVEGTARNKPQTGSSCYTHVKYPTAAWTSGGGTMLDATFNSPRMMWRTARVEYDGKWMKIPVDPQLVQAVARGLSHGLVLADEKGQTRENHDVFTRHQAGARPYLTVEGRSVHVAAPFAVKRPAFKAEPCPQASGLQTGAIRIDTRWAGKDVLGSTVWIRPDKGRRGDPIRAVTLSEPIVVVDGLRPDSNYTVGGASFLGPQGFRSLAAVVRSSAPLTVPAVPRRARATARTTPRNAWVGIQLDKAIPPGKGDLTVKLASLRYVGDQREEVVPPLKHVRAYRIRQVLKGKTYYPEVLVPTPGGAGKLFSDAIFVDIWVPEKAAPGPYAGKLAVLRNGKTVATIPVKIRVAKVALSDTFHIAGDMNTYGSPARAMGVRNSDPEAFMEMERKYYRLAHAHRMTLSVLPYSQSGSVHWRSAPKITGSGATVRVADWKDWDRRYGPLLSGKAFSRAAGYVGPGAGAAIRHMYLPFHENWPAKLAEHFKPWPPPGDYQKFLLWSAGLPPIEKSLSASATDAWRAVLKQFCEHLARNKWTRTRYQVYLNNKYYFRNKGGRGISLWLLDEPMFADDFLALAHYAKPLARLRRSAWSSAALGKIDYRIDISRPTHQRNWLDGLVDLNICADQLYPQRRLIAYRKRKFRERYWNYRMPPSFTGDNIAWTLWPVRSFCWGAIGTLGWQTIASDGDLDRADATALMYPGRKFGLDTPVPSIRMKAWRAGLQLTELLRILRTRRKWNDIQLRAFVGQAIGLAGWQKSMDPPPDAPIVTFASVTADKLARLRRATIAMLSK